MTNPPKKQRQGLLPVLIGILALFVLVAGVGYATNDKALILNAAQAAGILIVGLLAWTTYARLARKNGVRAEVAVTFPCSTVERSTVYYYLGLSHHFDADGKTGCPKHGATCTAAFAPRCPCRHADTLGHIPDCPAIHAQNQGTTDRLRPADA